MKLSDYLPRTGLKFLLLAYVFISFTYIGIQVFTTTNASLTRTTRRSVLEPDSFFIAPLTQDSLEQDDDQSEKEGK